MHVTGRYQGHYLVLPNTMDSLGHARIVLIVRNGLMIEKT